MALDTKRPKGYRKAWNGEHRGGIAKAREMTDAEYRRDYAPNWQRGCCNCAQKPVVPVSGLCGPCHWGTAQAIDGAWWDDKAGELRDFVFGG